MLIKAIFLMLVGVSSVYSSDVLRLERHSSLGNINGEVENDQVIINKILDNPTIFSINKQDLPSKIVDFVVIKNAKLHMVLGDRFSLVFENQLQNHDQVVVKMVLRALYDGNSSYSLMPYQVGNDVRFDITESYNTLEIKTDEPVHMTLPKTYRGEISFDIDIEGLTASIKNM